MEGQWYGTLGGATFTVEMAQDGAHVSGSAAGWGRIGTFTGLLQYSMVTFTIHLPGLCDITLHGYAGASPQEISGDYSGSDCAAGPYHGRLELRKR